MKKLNKRTRHSENAFSVERYDICSAQAENQWCMPHCNYNGSNPYALALQEMIVISILRRSLKTDDVLTDQYKECYTQYFCSWNRKSP